MGELNLLAGPEEGKQFERKVVLQTKQLPLLLETQSFHAFFDLSLGLLVKHGCPALSVAGFALELDSLDALSLDILRQLELKRGGESEGLGVFFEEVLMKRVDAVHRMMSLDYYSKFVGEYDLKGNLPDPLKCPLPDQFKSKEDTITYLKDKIKALQSQLFKERKVSAEVKQIASQLLQQRNKFYQLSVSQQKEVISIRRQLGQAKDRLSRETYQRNQQLMKFERQVEQLKKGYQEEREKAEKELRRDYERRLEEYRAEWLMNKSEIKKETNESEDNTHRIQALEHKLHQLQSSFAGNLSVLKNTHIREKLKTGSKTKTSEKSRRPAKLNKSQEFKDARRIEQELGELKQKYLCMASSKGEENRNALRQLIEKIQMKTSEYVSAKGRQNNHK